MIDIPASEILRQIFIDGAFVSLPSSGTTWPCFVGHLPDGDLAVDNAIAIYDDVPEKDGRLMFTGEVMLHYAVQILLRTNNKNQGWLKISQLVNYIDTCVNVSAVVDTVTFRLLSATQRSGVGALGSESKESQRRYYYDAKYILSIRTT